MYKFDMNVSVVFSDEARKKLEEGIDLVGKAVATTLGPKGRNSVIYSEQGPIITKDGVTVAKHFQHVEDPYVDLGVQLCKQVSMKTNDIAGDGTTTATVLARSIVNEGLRYVASGANPLSLKRGIDKAMDAALELVDLNSRAVEGQRDIEYVATISGNDPDVGRVTAEAIDCVGSDGIITLEESSQRDTWFQIVEGYSYGQGYVSPYLVNDYSKYIANYEDVRIIMIDGKVEAFENLIKPLELASKAHKPVLVIAESFSPDAIQGFVFNKVKGKFAWVATKTPGFGDQKKDLIHDICAMVGGEVFSESLGHKYSEFDSRFFGHAKRVIVTKETTTLLEGKKDEKKVSERIELLKNMLEKEDSEYNREKINERIAKLNEGVATIQVGGSTEVEMKEKKYRFEDALNATRAAIAEGIVPGGGSCLLRISETLEKNTMVDEKDADEMLGVKIMVKALKSPFRQICENGGFSAEVYMEKVLNSDYPMGFDAKYGEITDMFESGIIDPAKVTKSALANAVSIASLVLTTETLIAPVVDKTEKILMPEPMY